MYVGCSGYIIGPTPAAGMAKLSMEVRCVCSARAWAFPPKARQILGDVL